MSGTVIFRTDHQSTAFPCASEDGLENIDELLLIFKDPVQLGRIR